MRILSVLVLCTVCLTTSCSDERAGALGRAESNATDASVVMLEPDRIESGDNRASAEVRVILHQLDDAVNGLTFPDETSLLAAATNREVVLIDAISGKESTRFVPCRSCSSVRITRSDDGRELLIPGNARNTGAAYEAATGRKIRDLTGPDYRAAYSPDRTLLLSVVDRQAVIEDSVSKRLDWESGLTKIGAVAYAPDGSRFVISGDGDGERRSGGKVLIYNAATREIDTRIDYMRGAFNHLAFTPDSKRLVLGSYTKRVIVLDMAKSTVHCRFDSDTKGQGLRILKLSADGRLIATGGGDDQWGYVRLWDVETCTLQAEVNLRERVGSLSFSYKQAATGGGLVER